MQISSTRVQQQAHYPKPAPKTAHESQGPQDSITLSSPSLGDRAERGLLAGAFGAVPLARPLVNMVKRFAPTMDPDVYSVASSAGIAADFGNVVGSLSFMAGSFSGLPGVRNAGLALLGASALTAGITAAVDF